MKIACPFFMRFHSGSIGSFTFMIMSASAHVASAFGAILAPTAVYCSSVKPLPMPAPVSTSHGVAGADERLGAGGDEADAIFVGLDFLRDSDFHIELDAECGVGSRIRKLLDLRNSSSVSVLGPRSSVLRSYCGPRLTSV